MSDPTKTTIRNTIKHMRSKLSIDYQQQASQQVVKRIQSLELYKKANRIGLYYAVGGEINLALLWSCAVSEGKGCYFPALKEDFSLLFLPATGSTAFKKNRFGILEPEVGHDLALDVNQLDLIVLPLVAFDLYGTRLGMGAGYYDRTLEHIKNPKLLGAAYPFQKLDHIEACSWDVPLNLVVTPEGIYWMGADGGPLA